jgi:GT2 family glycosyltransferase
MKPLVHTVVVNYNAGEALGRCLQSVLAQSESVRLTLVDNASTDGSVERVAARFEGCEDFTLLRNPDNRGFAAAVNQGVEVAGGETPYLLILNPDCEMLPGSIRALRSALDGRENAALAGPMVIDAADRPARGTLRHFPDPRRALLTFSGLSRLGSRIPALEGVEAAAGLPDGVTVAEAVTGACMMLKSPAFSALGGLDEGFGLHCEDLDLMYRLRESGYCSLFVPAARVIHQQGVSSRSRPFWVHRQKHLGMQRFFLKHQAGDYAAPMRWLVIAGIWLRYAVSLPLVLARR